MSSHPIIADVWSMAQFKILEDSETSTGASLTNYLLRPDEGKRWRILCAWGTHNDTVNRVVRWLWFDGSLSIHHMDRSVAAAVKVPIHSFDGLETSPRWLLADPIITYRSYAVFQGVDIANAKKLSVEAAYSEVDE